MKAALGLCIWSFYRIMKAKNQAPKLENVSAGGSALLKYAKGGMKAFVELGITFAGIQLFSSQMMVAAYASVAQFLGPIGLSISLGIFPIWWLRARFANA